MNGPSSKTGAGIKDSMHKMEDSSAGIVFSTSWAAGMASTMSEAQMGMIPNTRYKSSPVTKTHP